MSTTISPDERRLLVCGNKAEGIEIMWTQAEEANRMYAIGAMRVAFSRKGRRTREFGFTTDKGRALLEQST